MRTRRSVKKLTNQGDRVRRTFFHQPMARAGNDFLLHIVRYVAHDYCLQRPEGLFSPYRHDRHGELRLLKNLVILCVLGEGGKLRESRPHTAGLRVCRCEEISGCFVGLPRITREVVPYAIEIDTLASGHQALCVWAVKVEVP